MSEPRFKAGDRVIDRDMPDCPGTVVAQRSDTTVSVKFDDWDETLAMPEWQLEFAAAREPGGTEGAS